MNVFELEKNKAVVKNVRNCTMCRECIRDEHGLKDKVELGKKRNYFIFTVESVGQIPAITIFRESLTMLIKKTNDYLKRFDEL